MPRGVDVPLKDLSGQRLQPDSRLTVRKYLGKRFWLCECDCGVEKAVFEAHLRRGAVRSCGCLGREENRKKGEAWKEALKALQEAGQLLPTPILRLRAFERLAVKLAKHLERTADILEREGFSDSADASRVYAADLRRLLGDRRGLERHGAADRS